MFHTFRTHFLMLAMLVVSAGCTQSFYTAPLKGETLTVSQAGLANSYDMFMRMQADDGTVVYNEHMARLSLANSDNGKIKLMYEITDPKARKEAEKKGQPVLATNEASVLRINGNVYFEIKGENKFAKGPVYSLSLLKKAGDQGDLNLQTMEVRTDAGAAYFHENDWDVLILDNSSLSTEQSLAKMRPVTAGSEWLVLVPRNH